MPSKQYYKYYVRQTKEFIIVEENLSIAEFQDLELEMITSESTWHYDFYKPVQLHCWFCMN